MFDLPPRFQSMPAIQISTETLTRLMTDARRDSTRECCGLLAGRDGVITHIFPAENVASDPSKNYEIAPKEIVRLMREFRAAGLTFLGIYHSHPNGENAPSARDIERAYYSEEAYFIISPRPDAPKPVRAFAIRDGRATELEISIL
jgi:proteasome lid subunit RPN8/RPN11